MHLRTCKQIFPEASWIIIHLRVFFASHETRLLLYQFSLKFVKNHVVSFMREEKSLFYSINPHFKRNSPACYREKLSHITRHFLFPDEKWSNRCGIFRYIKSPVISWLLWMRIPRTNRTPGRLINCVSFCNEKYWKDIKADENISGMKFVAGEVRARCTLVSSKNADREFMNTRIWIVKEKWLKGACLWSEILPLVMGETAKKLTSAAPVPCPNNVKCFESPPNAFRFSCSHWIPATKSIMP